MSLTVGYTHNNFTNQLQVEAKQVSFDQLPREMILEVFSYLNDNDRAKCSQVNKKWQTLSNDPNLLKVIPPAMAFGKEKWKTYFGDIGKEPPLPANIREILKSPCPIWEGKKIRDTHLLVLIPQIVNGKLLTKKSLGELAKKYFPNTEKGYRYIWSELIDEKNDKPIDKSYWMLMTKDVIPGSRYEGCATQQTIVSDLAKKALTNYEVPDTLEATVSIFSKYVSSGKYLFSDSPSTYTRCQENIRDFRVIVGCFASSGLDVNLNFFDQVPIGVAVLRKF